MDTTEKLVEVAAQLPAEDRDTLLSIANRMLRVSSIPLDRRAELLRQADLP